MTAMPTQTKQLTPMTFVSDIARSIAFYEHLGFAVANAVTPDGEAEPSWAWLSSGEAHLMITTACDPILADQQRILFYLYVDNVNDAHAASSAAGLQPGPITTPFYAPRGEFRLADPDGYTLVITHT